MKYIVTTMLLTVAIMSTVSCKSAKHTDRDYVLIRCGMMESEVRSLLGDDFDVDGYGAGCFDWSYIERGIIVSFDAEGRVTGVSVQMRERTEM